MLPDGWPPLVATLLLAVAGLRFRAVSLSGAVAGCVLGLLLTAAFGWAGLAMPLTLAVLGTVVSSHDHGARGRWQVLCNGGVAALAALAALAGWSGAVLAAAASLSAALADTASGELGRRLDVQPRLLLFGPRAQTGRDGAMSWPGTCAGMLFTWPVPLVAWALGALPDFAAVSAVAAAGFIGSVLDSVYGLTIQGRLGARGNDWVNLISTATAAVVVLVIAA